MVGIIGRKIGMTRVFDDAGKSIPVTVVVAGPCSVTQIKTEKTDGYDAVQIGFLDKKEKNTSKAELKHFAKAGVKPKKVVKEVKGVAETNKLKLGDSVTVEIFEEGEGVMVTGFSKGKGFQGVVKRHGFKGGPKTHGQSDRLRAPGSIGQSAYPARVFKGVRMGGRMGNRKVTLKKKKIIKIDVEKNILMIKGPVPGPNSGLLLIRK